MLSAYLFMAQSYRRALLNCLGFEAVPSSNHDENTLKVWLRSAKVPVDGEGLSDKGFFGTYLFFA